MQVLILMGSDSDWPVMQKALKVLKEFGVEAKAAVASAHRTPHRARELVLDAEKKGAKVFIAGAGGAAHLAGFVAAHTVRPVIGVPLSSMLAGADSLLSTVQMPTGVPVATVAVDGAANAGMLALQVLAASDDELRDKLAAHRRGMEQEVLKKSKKVEEAEV